MAGSSEMIVLACSVLGLLISFYFVLVYYGVMKPDAAFIPRFCRLDEKTCQYLMSTQNARILGTPNFVLGLLYYSFMILYTSIDLVSILVPFAIVALGSSFTILLGIYLVYGLIVKLKTNCILCFTSHTLNLVIFLALITNYS